MTSVESEIKQDSPRQEEMPFALVQGQPLTVLPTDLYIPPDALEVFLEAFEGPLDLLLYLIKKQNLDILNIPIANITGQYMQYIDMMDTLRIELAAEYLVMAAMLAEIKSRMLLPRPDSLDEEDDPRAELIRRLQEYERFRQAAEDMEDLPRVGREIHMVSPELPELPRTRPLPDVDLRELLLSLKEVMVRAEMYSHHQILKEVLSVRERMSKVLASVGSSEFVEFTSLFTIEEGRRGVVVSLLAILELVKEALIDIVQAEPYAKIYVKVASQEMVGGDPGRPDSTQ